MKTLKRIIIMCTALVVATGALFLLTAASSRVAKGVTVNGTDVGGMSFTKAYSRLKAQAEEGLKGRRLRICADDKTYEFVFPEITYEEHFMSILRQAERGQSFTCPVSYRLDCQDEVVSRICAAADVQPIRSRVKFNAEGAPFTYIVGKDGRQADAEGLKRDIALALEEGTDFVQVRFNTIAYYPSLAELRRDTCLLACFSTEFDSSAEDRAHNIALAAQKLNGSIISPGGVLSFNRVVGERTAKNGFREAKIISGGKYVQGYGGGVCQVSTTLYNAALLAGLKVEEYHPHSLQVGYVPPSRDAMVSGDYFDLKIRNNRQTDVYVRAEVKGGRVSFRLYGTSDGVQYCLESVDKGAVPCPEPVVLEGEEDKILTPAREGRRSECYLVMRSGGREERVLLRKDEYLPTAEVRQTKRKSVDSAVS